MAAGAALLALGLCRGLEAADDVARGAKRVRSLEEARNAQVVRQHWDLSCGAAAIATLLSYQLGDLVSERQVATDLLHLTDPLLVRQRLGFSLLDLKRYAESRSFAATGYGNLTLDELIPWPLRLRLSRSMVSTISWSYAGSKATGCCWLIRPSETAR